MLEPTGIKKSTAPDITALSLMKKATIYWCITRMIYAEIEGDPLWDPNRHTRIKRLEWDNGFPYLW